MKYWKDALLIIAIVIASIALVYPVMMQEINKPVPKSNVWQKFAECEIDKHYLEGKYSIDYTAEVQAMAGKQIALDGFVLPLESSNKSSHFLLSIRSPSCSYCPSGAPNEIVEVFTKKPIAWSDELMTFSGTLKLAETKNETGIFFQLVDAEAGNTTPATPITQSKPAAIKHIGEYVFTQLKGKNLAEKTSVRIDNWKNQKLLVLFWKSDCPPCLQEMKLLPELAKQNANLQIALISLSNEKDTKEHLGAMPSNVNILLANDDAKEVLSAFKNNRMLALPYSVMLNVKGDVCNNHYGIISPDKIKQWRKEC
jgi:peroxiredoxin